MSLDSLLSKELSPWMLNKGEEGDIVLSSRVRLARNIAKIPFPNKADNNQLALVVESMRDAVNQLDSKAEYEFAKLEDLQPLDRYLLVEKHIISPLHVKYPEDRALIARKDGAVSIMVNEEDHLRIQAVTAGLDLTGVLELADFVDDRLEEHRSFAFDETLGYITACPTNLGTGLRASVMIHLPALVITKQLNRLIAAATQLGLAVRGLYGEGSDAVGNIFQISNQLTLGYNETEIVDNLSNMARQVVEQERAAREYLLKGSNHGLSDNVWRAFGVLRYARCISSQEALSLLSQVRMGVDLGIINEIPGHIFNELIVTTRPNYLQKFCMQNEIDVNYRNVMRAEIIRHRLGGGQ